MDAKWTAITIISCVAVAAVAVAHVVITLILVQRYRWPFWLSLNFAWALIALPMIKGQVSIWGLQLQVDAVSGTWAAIIASFVMFFGFMLQRHVIQMEERILDPDFQEALAVVSEAFHKKRDPIEAGRIARIPKSTVQAAMHCWMSIKVGKDR